MKKVNVPTREEVDQNTRQMFDQIQRNMGKIPNLYATIGHSGSALKGFLAFEAAMADSAFSPKEKEAIALVVSQVNSCDYCLAAHTMLAGMKGLKKEDTIEIRTGHFSEQKLNALVELAKAVTQNKGKVEPSILEAFFKVGYNERALIELMALIALRVFTNYVFAATEIPIDFPLADQLSEV